MRMMSQLEGSINGLSLVSVECMWYWVGEIEFGVGPGTRFQFEGSSLSIFSYIWVVFSPPNVPFTEEDIAVSCSCS